MSQRDETVDKVRRIIAEAFYTGDRATLPQAHEATEQLLAAGLLVPPEATHPCPRCDGRGEVAVMATTEITGYDQCPACSSTGVVACSFVPPGLTAEKLRTIADGCDFHGEGCGDCRYSAVELRAWADFLDTQETPK